MKRLLFFIIPILLINYYFVGCEFNYRKNTDAYSLVKALRQNNLYTKFNGFSVTPRDEATNLYIFWRDEKPKIEYWLKYDSRGPEYFYIDENQVEENISIIKEFDSIDYNKRNDEYLTKAFELISILKRLDIRWAGAPYGKFNCSFNDSTRLSYIEKGVGLDSSFYRSHKEYEWIDSNFITYY